MKLYALIGGWDYEGHDEPVGIYSTKEKAEAAKAVAYKSYDELDIYEYELDVHGDNAETPPEPQVEQITVAAGTVVSFGGVPFKLVNDTVVEGHRANIAMVALPKAPKPDAAADTEQKEKP